MSTSTSTAADSDLLEQYETFLRRYYHEGILDLAGQYPSEQQSLAVDWMDLFQFDPDLVDDIRAKPADHQQYLDAALRRYDVPIDVDLANAHVRIHNVPEIDTYAVGGYRADTIGQYLAVEGQVQRQTEVVPQPVEAAYECQRCGHLNELPLVDGELQEPHECQGCDRQGPFRLDRRQTEWEDYQRLRLQLPPEQSKGGSSATVDVHTRADLVGSADVGDRVTVTGQLDVAETDDNYFDPEVEGHHVSINQTDYENIDVEEHLEEIHELTSGERGDPYELLVNSIAPAIFGMDEIKEALALQLFGGARVERPDGTSERGDIHTLLLGDPGTAKSSLLKDVEQKAPRSTFASGKGATAAGLTAAAVKDDFGGEQWTLKAGALVQADKGIACVDEIDKVDEGAVASMHEALSHQTVHVDKAGHSAHLPTRTALLAAGNPEYGRFQDDKPVAEQIDLGPTLLSRFDLLFMVEDRADPETDAEIIEGKLKARRAAAHHTADDRRGGAVDVIEPAVETEVLRAWVAHAKQTCLPTIEDEDVAQDLKKSFHNLRQAGGDNGPIPVTFRRLEALQRLAEASARVRLSETVEQQDVDRARQLVGRSLSDVGIDPESGQFDADIIETGEAQSQKERREGVLAYIREQAGPDPVGHETIVEDGAGMGLSRDQIEWDLAKLSERGEIYEPQQDRYRPT